MKNKILIIGAGGLLGQEVCKCLLNQGYDVVATLKPGGSQLEFSHEKLTTIHLDLNSCFDLKEFLAKEVSDIIYLAQSPGHNNFPLYSGSISNLNFSSVINLVEQAVESKVNSFIYASSGGVYEVTGHLLTEDSLTKDLDDLNLYLGTKLMAEKFLIKFSNYIRISICRYFFIFGFNQKEEMLIPRLINQVRQGGQISLINGTGPTINPIFVCDAAEATVSILKREFSGIVNIAGPNYVKISEIVSFISNFFGLKENTKQIKGNSDYIVADVSKLLSLEFTHKYEFFEVLNEILKSESGKKCVV